MPNENKAFYDFYKAIKVSEFEGYKQAVTNCLELSKQQAIDFYEWLYKADGARIVEMPSGRIVWVFAASSLFDHTLRYTYEDLFDIFINNR